MITTPELEARGLSVRVHHARKMVAPSYDLMSDKIIALIQERADDSDLIEKLLDVIRPVPAPKSGRTEAYIVNADGDILAEGFAPCSKKDNYDRRKGRKIAVGRAIKHLNSTGA